MAAYSYRAVDAAGKVQVGSIEADSAKAVRQTLRAKSWLPISVESPTSTAGNSNQNRWFGPSLSVAQLAMVTRQLATLVSSGMPLDECLLAVAEQSEQRKTTYMMMAVRSRVLEGFSLANALGEFPRTFSVLYLATVEAGEQSGHLNTVLDRLADHVESQDKLRKELTVAAIYPLILVLVAISVVVYLLQSVVPNILDVFVTTGQVLPAPTQWLLNATEFVDTYGVTLVAMIIGLILLGIWWQRHSARAMVTDRIILKLPIAGKLSKRINTARFASTLATLVTSGTPLVDAMQIASRVIMNRRIAESMVSATQQVREGSTLAAALNVTGYCPPMMVHMVASGESSGKLDVMLDRTAKAQEKSLADALQVTVALLEPLMLVLMGGMILIIVMAVVLPITQMTTGVG